MAKKDRLSKIKVLIKIKDLYNMSKETVQTVFYRITRTNHNYFSRLKHSVLIWRRDG